MSPANSNILHESSSPLQRAAGFREPVVGQPHLAEHITEVLKRIAPVIAPVWPLQDYVAVNPYAGICERSFLDARALLRIFSDCETLMPVEFYREQYQQGMFTWPDVEAAVNELRGEGFEAPDFDSIRQTLEPLADSNLSNATDQANPPRKRQRVETLAATVDRATGSHWSETIDEEISKLCAAHYDRGQASWSSPWKHLPLFQAWRQAAQFDRQIEVLGLSGFRKFVKRLPHTPEACIVAALEELAVPPAMWDSVLLCQAFAMPGWSAWTRYQTEEAKHQGLVRNEFAGLLAIRLAYEVYLAKSIHFRVDWSAYVEHAAAAVESTSFRFSEEARLRYILLRATELAYRRQLLGKLSERSLPKYGLSGDDELAAFSGPDNRATYLSSSFAELRERPQAQMVFCIDVRSERLRRQLEAVNSEIETFGFAGFFGMPIEYSRLGESERVSHVPVLLRPQLRVQEGVRSGDTVAENSAVEQRKSLQAWQQLWASLQSSAVSCFSFVETTGLLYGYKLLARTGGKLFSGGKLLSGGQTSPNDDGVSTEQLEQLGPTLRGLNVQGFCTSKQAELAEGVLRNLGMTKGFSRLVVFCGHASQTTNNPLHASLDCGACGGHSGEPNARLAALLLNQPYIRRALAERGIEIPIDTHFMAGLHNTATDQVELFDRAEVPASHRVDVQALQRGLAQASLATSAERLPSTGGQTVAELMRRAYDWSEVRPEWGLAGNAAFIVAPRELSRGVDLGGRAFLHSYDHRQDPEGKVLELIMTAPLVVANWINLQYYASTVDQRHFGSGTKTVHNVVGKFGLLSGNGGDLQTGLPWQSLHDGSQHHHTPLRLQAVIAAPRSAIEQIIDRHEVLANLLTGGWMHLLAIDNGKQYRYNTAGSWQSLGEVPETLEV